MLDMQYVKSPDLDLPETRTLTELVGGIPAPKVADATHSQQPG